ncbi:MAG: DUF1592 domain-containing protein [Alphaproteobacteria bacterium]|nr:DUF1592 domain-containing protein [Alphaproteobacteria bacterium]
MWTILATLAACTDPQAVPPDEVPRGEEPVVLPAPATLRRLTRAQYEATLEDLLGPGLVLPPYLEPDLAVEGLFSVGAGQASLSPYGVEQYETAAQLVASQVMGDPDRRAAVVPCTPSAPDDRGCAEDFVRSFGRLAWRRTLTEPEVTRLADVAVLAGTTLDSGDTGLEYAMSALLQSPNFLYRVEIGQGGHFDDLELASRLSYLLWGGPPDAELLDAAEAGELADPAVRRAQAERLLDDPRAKRGVRAMFAEILGLYGLDTLNKDPNVFLHFSDSLGDSAREETLWTVEQATLGDVDFRELMLSRRTWLDRTLAAVYDVPAPSRDGFGEAELPLGGNRQGLLGQVSFLALRAHPVSTSVTRRGVFVRETLLCQGIPSPPANVDTSIPESTPETPTMRDRVAVHLEDPTCATCHKITDPVGLSLEHLDGIGRYRPDDQGYAIDASGELDGETFDGLAGLAWTVHVHPAFPVCMTQHALAFAQGHVLSDGEEELVDWHAEGFVGAGWRWRELMLDLVASDTFTVAEVQP